MNEYDRLHRQIQRYRELYPKGTRILLLHMGDDPRPVEDDMRGTVMFVDDILDSLSAEQQRVALVHLSVKRAEQKAGGHNAEA